MRLLVVAVALLMLLLLPPAPLAAGQAPPAAVATDAEGDVRTQAQDTPAPGPGEAYSGLDLVGLSIVEGAEDITFTLAVADLKPAEQETALDGLAFQVLFSHNGRSFRLSLLQNIPQLGSSWFAWLESRDSADAEWTQSFADAEAQGDAAADTIATVLDRDLLADRDGAAPFPGRSLEGIRVQGWGYAGNMSVLGGLLPDVRSPVRIVDDMPDAGMEPARYAVQVGLAQTGHAQLTSHVPYRASNGEATTFLLNATAHNLGAADDTFEFAAVGAPGRLAITVPVTVATIPAGGRIEVPVLVTVPFAHVHGGVDDFTLEMRSTTDPGSVGRVAMGIRYLEVPQPAGHHDSLYLHTVSQDGGLLGEQFPDGYLNTLDDDALDTAQPYPSPSQSIDFGKVVHTWSFPLEPGLQMGLDLDLSRVGRLAVSIGATVVPQAGSTVEAYVYVGTHGFRRYGEEVVDLAHMAPTEAVDLMPQATHLFEGDLVPLPDADRIPFSPASNLFLDVELTTASPSVVFSERPFIAPGGHLTLPLLEYHDPVDDALALLGGPGLAPLGAQERLVNPGKAIVFPFSLANPAGEERAYHIDVSGSNAEWGSLASDHIKVPAHGLATGQLIVRAPPGAQDGDRADLILQAYDTSEPAARGLLRLLAEVDTDAQHPDDTAVADDLAKKESPGVGLAPLVLAMGLAALAFARRRR